MQKGRSIPIGWHCAAIGVMCSALTITTGSARAATLSITVSNVTLQQTAINTGQPLTMSYVLGGAGINTGTIANVKIDIIDGATIAKTVTLVPPAVGTQRGDNTVVVDTTGVPSSTNYKVRVTASVVKTSISGPNGTDWFLITDPTDPALQIANPRGVDVNRNPASPAFGRVYMSEGLGATLPGRDTRKGIYVLNSNLSETFPGAEPKAKNSGTNGGTWGVTSNSPHRVVVGPDDMLYICDWSDAHAGLYIADSNGDNIQDLLAFNPPGGQRGTPTAAGLVIDSGGNELYSSTSTVLVEGTGAARKIYRGDYYMTPPGSVFRYDIPAGTAQWASVPNATAIANTVYNADTYLDVVRDSAGNFYLSNYYTDEAFKFDAGGNKLAQLGTTGSFYYGIAIDDARNKIALAAGDGKVYLTDKTFATATAIVSGIGATVRDVAFDADGWLYEVNSDDQRLAVYAPPGTYPISGGTATGSQTLVITSIPIPGDIAPVGPSGINIGPNGHKFGDGKVDLQDVVYSMRVFAGLNQIP